MVVPYIATAKKLCTLKDIHIYSVCCIKYVYFVELGHIVDLNYQFSN